MNAVSPPSSRAVEAGLTHLPVFFSLRGRTALLIGGADAARAKGDLLRRAGAHVRTVAGQLLQPHHFDGAVLAIVASNDLDLSSRAVELARRVGVPINVVDRPELCDFIMPSILDRSPVIVAVSTGGLAPALARLIRQRLESALPPGIGRLAAMAGRFHRSLAARLPQVSQRMRFWESLFDGAPAALIAEGRSDDAEVAAEALLEALRTAPEAESIATLPVGSNDPDSLTVRAARLIRMAEVIFHEPGVPPSIVALGRRDALKIAVPRGSAVADLAITGRGGLQVHLIAEVQPVRNTLTQRGAEPPRPSRPARTDPPRGLGLRPGSCCARRRGRRPPSRGVGAPAQGRRE